ncbi:Hypothetical protein CINCED_3A018521 [Cinara cedri]|uniref:Fatty acyl-CoA reductase n=1 Tax=Cinara cedri TaxID=506608 RepID=A0A5E4MIF7_9HEMI|nr:Hypothetical protein CINCED_3A018521 [Cinara cedri]
MRIATDTTMQNTAPCSKTSEIRSEIQSFYNDKTIFLTGATGFIGSLILEKLLRTCTGIKRIYILIREKKGKTPEERFTELFEGPVFELVKNKVPDYLKKITAVIGDCALPDLGIGEQYREIFKYEVNIILHSAATVRFDEHLRKAVHINIGSLQSMIKLCKEMKHLKSFVYISTAYSNCAGRKVVEEMFYKPPLSGDQIVKLVNILEDEQIERITPSLLNEFPNTYTITKAIAEYEIFTHGKELPIGILRPSMITATENEPLPAWINNFYGPTGVTAAIGLGLMRVMRVDPNKIADIVPGDYVSNAVLACAWDIHNKWKEHNVKYNTANMKDKNDSTSEPKSFSPPIYNYVSSNTNRLTWREFSRYNQIHVQATPSVKSYWPIMLWMSQNKYEYAIMCFLVHTIPAYIVDSVAKLAGKTPTTMATYKKLHKFVNVTSYFSLRSWTFHETNTRSLLSKMSKFDQSLFRFDIAKLNWNDYFTKHVKGVRVYILGDPLETVPAGVKHVRKLYMAHYTLLAFLSILLLLVIYGLFYLLTV